RETFTPHHVVMPRLDEEYVTELERLDLTIAEVLDSSNGMSARGRNIGPVICQLMVVRDCAASSILFTISSTPSASFCLPVRTNRKAHHERTRGPTTTV